MRFFSKCWGGIKKAYSVVAEKVSAGYEAVKAGARWIGHQVNKGYKKFTGQEKAEEAELRYAKLEEKVRKKESDFKDFALKKERQINAEIEKINQSRIELSDGLFSRYESIASHFANLEVVGICGDQAMKAKRKTIALKAKSSLFKIDFRNHPVKANALAIVTLGFLTRKRADQSLKAVEAEEIRIEQDFAQLEAEKQRLESMLSTLKQISLYLTKTAKTYERILNELDYSVMFLRSTRRVMNFGTELRSVFDVEFLPEHQLVTLMCADKVTRILHAIASKQYVKAEGERIVINDSDVNVWEKGKKEFQETIQKMAA